LDRSGNSCSSGFDCHQRRLKEQHVPYPSYVRAIVSRLRDIIASELSITATGRPFVATGVDVVVITLLMTGGFLFLWNAPAWAPGVYIGHDQFGDADFWWQGALQWSQGLFWQNLNMTYRMGYAIFSGPFVALFGPEYGIFHKLLVLLFLAVAAAGYVVAARQFGRVVAAALIASLVFSPIQGERLAISTSDGLGLIWNLAALLAFWYALDERIRFRWLAVAGMFLALGGLTRPLMTVFIAPAALLVFIMARGSLHLRATAVATVIGAFVLPTLLWAAAFYLKTGDLGVAGNGASTFYAASNPKFQVWNPAMYPPVETAAKARLGVSRVTGTEMDKQFRIEALQNYIHEFAYHLKRLPGHVYALARFSFKRYTPTERSEVIARGLIRGLLSLALIASCLIVGTPKRAMAVGAIFVLSLWQVTAGLVVTAAALVFLLPRERPELRPVHRLVAAYWWSGVASLYFTGGTWGPPLIDRIDVNALGYRLGGQFLFVNEWLVLFALLAVGGSLKPLAVRRLEPHLAALSRLRAGRSLRAAAVCGLLALTGLFVVGSAIAGVRGWRLAHAAPVAMPPVAPLVASLCGAEGGRQAQPGKAVGAPVAVLGAMWGESEPDKRLEQTRLFTGAVGGLIWQMESQNRTRALFYQQDLQSPFTINPARMDVEFAGLPPENEWRNRQGAWIIRSFREVGPHTGYLFYESLPKVEMFVPLSVDRTSFELAQAMRFPIARYASVLVHSGQLAPIGGTLEWMKYPSSDAKRRWFILQPSDQAGARTSPALSLDLTGAIGRRRLAFSFRVEPAPGKPRGVGPIVLTIGSVDTAGQSTSIVSRTAIAHGAAAAVPTEDVAVDLPAQATRVRVGFSGLSADEMVRVAELQLTSDDVSPGLADALCTAP
jgi:hypothetical protein